MPSVSTSTLDRPVPTGMTIGSQTKAKGVGDMSSRFVWEAGLSLCVSHSPIHRVCVYGMACLTLPQFHPREWRRCFLKWIFDSTKQRGGGVLSTPGPAVDAEWWSALRSRIMLLLRLRKGSIRRWRRRWRRLQHQTLSPALQRQQQQQHRRQRVKPRKIAVWCWSQGEKTKPRAGALVRR